MVLYQEASRFPRRGPGNLIFRQQNKTLNEHRGSPLIGNIPGMAHSGACNQTPGCNGPRDPFQPGYMIQHLGATHHSVESKHTPT